MTVRGRGPFTIRDARGGDATMRVSWHAAQRKVVVSHWHGAVCTASTAVDIEDVPQLVSAFVGALGEAAAQQSQTPNPRPRFFDGVMERSRQYLRRLRQDRAAVVPMPSAAAAGEMPGARDSARREHPV